MHEDAWLIVVDKPAGLAVRSKGARTSLERLMERYLRQSRPDARAVAVHELDQAASGLVVLAKHPRAAASLRLELAPLRAGRTYLAVVDPPPEGEGAPEAMTLQSVLAPSPRGVAESLPPGAAPTGARRRPAVTHVRTLKTGPGGSLLFARCETDLPYQVRAHLAESGRPIVGDRAYSSPRTEVGRLCLHLSELSFKHPKTGEVVRYRSPTPPEFEAIVEGREPDAQVARTQVTDAEGRSAGETSWEHVADWYDALLAGGRSDHHERTILPGVIRLLDLAPGQRLLDIACGQGALARGLADALPGADIAYVGVDAAESLIESARRDAPPGASFLVADARHLEQTDLEPASFDAAACVLALMNFDPIAPALTGAAHLLRPGGRLVCVILHPAFRAPGRTHWGWATSPEDGARVQFRRVDAYLSPSAREVVMNPGSAAKGAEPVTTTTFHRPIEAYASAIAGAGLVIDAIEEWASGRRSEPGPNANEEDRARAEIPMFLAIRAVRPSAPSPDTTGAS
ncbi:MAG: pseudouridine synthase [Phycisphaerales bacterium]